MEISCPSSPFTTIAKTENSEAFKFYHNTSTTFNVQSEVLKLDMTKHGASLIYKLKYLQGTILEFCIVGTLIIQTVFLLPHHLILGNVDP